MKEKVVVALVFFFCIFMVAATSAEVGDPVVVAPEVKGTRMQMWPRAAWSDGAGCYLVVWREGDITDIEADIWCARLSADGKSMDPRGIRVTKAKDVQDRPSVASDGKNFLVVWEDIRSGKDYDVYAARVTADGRVLDPDGILVAGGEHNQCRPVVVYSGQGYVVVWQSFVRKTEFPGKKGTGYVLKCARVSSEGKVLDATPVTLSDPKPRMHVWQPFAAAAGDRVLFCAYMREFGPSYKRPVLGVGVLSASDMKVLVPLTHLGASGRSYTALPVMRVPVQSPAVVWAGKAFLVGFPTFGAGQGPGRRFFRKHSVAVVEVGRDGKGKETPQFAVFSKEMVKRNPCISMAFDGSRCLVVEDVCRVKGVGEKEVAKLRVMGYFLTPEGKPEGKAFLIAGDDAMKRDCMQGFTSSDGKGRFLVVYVDARGVDDVKVVGRIVK